MGTPPAAGPAGGEPSPGGAPTLTPEDNKGEKASAAAGVQIARRMLEHALVAFGSETPQGKACHECIGKLAKAFAMSEDQSESIMPAELKSALMAPSAGGGGPAEGPPQAAPGGAAAAAA